MSNWTELDRAINILRSCPNLIPMQCSSSYPCRPESVGLNVINEILDGKSKFVNQDNSKATYAKKITKNEGQIDWNSDALKIIGKINGLYPSPGAFFNFNGQRYKILKAEIGNGIGHNGEVISDNHEIACGGEKSIRVLEIQREGKKIQKIEEFLLGSKIIKGSIISNV